MQMCRRESGFVNRNFRQQEVNRPSIGDGAMLAGRERNNRSEDSSESLSRGTNIAVKRPHIAEPCRVRVVVLDLCDNLLLTLNKRTRGVGIVDVAICW